MTRNYNQQIGSDGEEAAALFLQEQGFTICERNYRFRDIGEIDIIARKEGLLIFVEVKTRMSGAWGGALSSITGPKKRRLRLIAGQYLEANRSLYPKETTCRFDLIAIEDDLTWVKDIVR